MKTSGQLLKEYRLSKELTLDQLADAIGYSKSYLSLLEASKRPLTDEVMYTILGYLKTSKIELATIKDARIHESPALSVSLMDLKPHQKELVIKFIDGLHRLSTVKCEKIIEVLK